MDYDNLTPQYRIEEYLEAIVEGWVDATMVAYPDYPSWRIEEFLDAFITYIWEDGDHPRHPCPEPAWRLEECLRAIYDVMTGAATPWPFPLPTTNRIEEYLAAIHAYLADGTELPVPEPAWRIEQWLAYVLDAVKQGGGVETTVSGTLVHITNALAKAALSVLVSIEPIQDLHGYSSPWPGGGGKNLFNADAGANGYIDNSGAVVSRSYQFASDYIAVTAGSSYTISAASTMANIGIAYFDSNKAIILPRVDNASRQTLTITPATGVAYVRFWINKGTSTDLNPTNVKETYKVQFEAGSSATSYAPYSNICPISGRTGLSVDVSPTQDPDDATVYNADWTTQAGTVYGGTLDVVTGVLTVDMANIASYNGEVINEPWLSSMDAYAAGTTPTTGAQVVYKLATPLTYQLTPQEVQMLLGENYVWSSSGDTVSVTYYAEGNANPLQSLNILFGGNYSNPKTADDVSDREALEIILGGNK